MDLTIKDIDTYISRQPKDIQPLLRQMRATIRKAAPEATEAIKYGMPTFVQQGNLLHFAACKNHIGFYPAPSGIEAYRKELSVYHCSKGAVQLPLDKPLPLALIAKVVQFRVAENIEKAAKKKAARSPAR